MSSVSPDRIRTSVGIKVAGLFVLTVLSVTFFAFPLSSFAASGNFSVNLVGVVQASQVFGARAGSINRSLSSLIIAPITLVKRLLSLGEGPSSCSKLTMGT